MRSFSLLVHLRGVKPQHHRPPCLDNSAVCKGGPHVLGLTGHLRWQACPTAAASLRRLLLLLLPGYRNQEASSASDLATLLGPAPSCSSFHFIHKSSLPSGPLLRGICPGEVTETLSFVKGQNFRPREPNACRFQPCLGKTPGVFLTQ